MYKGYMHENKRTGVSLTTKMWALLLKGKTEISVVKYGVLLKLLAGAKEVCVSAK